MPTKTFLAHSDMTVLLNDIVARVKKQALGRLPQRTAVYGVPRGGVPILYVVAESLEKYGVYIVDTPEEAHTFVDDIVDSGETKAHYLAINPTAEFFALIDKTAPDCPFSAEEWIVFPWESADTEKDDDSIVATLHNRLVRADIAFNANDNISSFIRKGELPVLEVELTRRAEYFLRGLIIDTENDPNFHGTANRLAKMWLHEVFGGRYTPRPALTTFPNTNALDELYTVGPITVRSACSHHLVPVTGKCWIGVIPGEKLIGLSKFHRIVDWLARRPQMQEELVVQIADTLENLCQPLGLAVVLEAEHNCVSWRGVKDSIDSKMTSSVMRGALKDNAAARAEFLSLINRK